MRKNNLGLIVPWPDVPEGQTAPMTFSHEDKRKARKLAHDFAMQPRRTFNRICDALHDRRYKWTIVVETTMLYTNPRTGAETEEAIKSVIKPEHRHTLYELAGVVEDVQRDDMADSTKRFVGRKINCYCKG